ncbi:hypothetical protein SDJN03_27263, partial [Cucurbita argyrosperma subsp. sororia]
MEKGLKGTLSRKYLELTEAEVAGEGGDAAMGDSGEETVNLSIFKAEVEARASLCSSSLMVSKALGVLRRITETNCGGHASLMNRANRDVAAIFEN